MAAALMSDAVLRWSVCVSGVGFFLGLLAVAELPLLLGWWRVFVGRTR